MNNWSPGYGASVVPHGRGGALQDAGDYSNKSASGASSVELGATGGNIGYMDGSASWKPIQEMKLRRGSQRWGSDGCWAMW